MLNRTWLTLTVLGSVLGVSGCQTSPANLQGTWINQTAITETVRQGNVVQVLHQQGPNLEWQFDLSTRKARFMNGFERAEGALLPGGQNKEWQVSFTGMSPVMFKLKNGQLIQQADAIWPEQRFSRVSSLTTASHSATSAFQSALNQAWLAGTWQITDGAGQGSSVLFSPEGTVTGLPGADRYELCLAGDCADMSQGQDNLWLEQKGVGYSLLMTLKEHRLSLYESVNLAGPDEKSLYERGQLKWQLERIAE